MDQHVLATAARHEFSIDAHQLTPALAKQMRKGSARYKASCASASSCQHHDPAIVACYKDGELMQGWDEQAPVHKWNLSAPPFVPSAISESTTDVVAWGSEEAWQGCRHFFANAEMAPVPAPPKPAVVVASSQAFEDTSCVRVCGEKASLPNCKENEDRRCCKHQHQRWHLSALRP